MREENREALAKALAGTSAGVLSTCLCSPLDVAKTRVQVATTVGGAEKYDGIVRALVTIYREEGFVGWFHGLTPAVCSVGVFWTVYFPCYDAAKERWAAACALPLSSPTVHVLAAGTAGCVTDVLTNPLWVVRTRLATQALRQRAPAPAAAAAGTAAAAASAAAAAAASAADAGAYRGMGDAFVRMAREEGVMSFFKGLKASLLGLSHIMIQFPLYERIKADLEAREGEMRLQHVIAASAASKLVASTITYPHEVIRARLQFDRGGELGYTGLGDAFAKTLRADGVGGLWQGFRLNIVRTIPQCIITFTAYEALCRHILARLPGGADGARPREAHHSRLARTPTSTPGSGGT